MGSLLNNLVDADMAMMAFTRNMGFDQNLQQAVSVKTGKGKNKKQSVKQEESGWEEIKSAGGKVIFRNRATSEYRDCYPSDIDTTNPCTLKVLPTNTHFAIDLEKAGYDSERSGEVLGE